MANVGKKTVKLPKLIAAIAIAFHLLWITISRSLVVYKREFTQCLIAHSS
ncbi:hypothetical protein [Brunnivagina elsteri]|nr:hypothetical protein [Calothrix elsteri]